MVVLEDSSCLSSYYSHYRVMVLFSESLFLFLLMSSVFLLSVPVREQICASVRALTQMSAYTHKTSSIVFGELSKVFLRGSVNTRTV